jgi:hypothetical protein
MPVEFKLKMDSAKLSPDKKLLYIEKEEDNETEGSILIDTNSLEILMNSDQTFEKIQNDMLFSAMKSNVDNDYLEAVDLYEGDQSTTLMHQHYEPRIVSKHYESGKFTIIHDKRIYKFGTMKLANLKPLHDKISDAAFCENFARFSIHNEMNGEKDHEFDLEVKDDPKFEIAGDDLNLISAYVHLYWFVKKK